MENTPNIISAIFGAVGDAITGFSNCVSSSVTSVISMFYDSTNGLTVLGTLSLIAVGAGLVFWSFRLIKGLVKKA